MDQLHVFIILFLGAVASSQAHINGSVLNLTVSHGGNATLYCDCKSSTGVYIVWYRNCSHVNQPTLVMKTRYPSELLPLSHEYKDDLHPFPRFHLVKNESSESFDLLIMNISDSDEGLYYCGTEQVNTKDGKEKDKYIPTSYGNVTRRILTSKEPEVHEEGSSSSDRMRGNQDGDVCYAALEIRQTTQRPKRKKTQSSDFSTYSDIKTCRL
ncbi:uncharacterized protein LOC118117935 isoform X5 [Hippoglossus stenolepis]|uniref:uncharacterized protein LOC118117935 isoform X5 n=1 Tax=Hippoglossus stenolepis TaxID=195615 RepID=UPI001FAEBBA6|nr:uncharacterized protein LOC118117935 isoform X5 [Hippoglossus stenolepis]